MSDIVIYLMENASEMGRGARDAETRRDANGITWLWLLGRGEID